MPALRSWRQKAIWFSWATMKITTYPIPECGSFQLKMDNMAEFTLGTRTGAREEA